MQSGHLYSIGMKSQKATSQLGPEGSYGVKSRRGQNKAATFPADVMQHHSLVDCGKDSAYRLREVSTPPQGSRVAQGGNQKENGVGSPQQALSELRTGIP